MKIQACILLAMLGLQGCWLKRKDQTPVPPALTPKPLPPISGQGTLNDPVIEPPADSTATTVSPGQIPIPPAPDVEAPRPSRKKAGNGGTNSSNPTAQKKPAAPKAQPVPAPATVPRLGEILSPEVRASYERDYAAHVAKAQEVLTQAAGRNLDSNQEQTIERIRAFLLQADEIRYVRGELSNALEIARRASLLAEDLVRTFR